MTSLIEPYLLFAGRPIPIYKICKCYPLTIDEIYSEDLGIERYNLFLNYLTLDNEDVIGLLEKRAVKLTNPDFSIFEYLLQSAENDEKFFLDLTDAFTTFIKEKVLLLPKLKCISIGNPLEKRLMTEKEFLLFSNVLRAQNHMYVKEEVPENESSMARKFREKRELRERTKRKQQSKKGESISFLDQISSLIVANVGITYENIGNCTLYPIQVLIERMQARESYENDIKFLCAGADSKKIKVKYWIRDLNDK